MACNSSGSLCRPAASAPRTLRPQRSLRTALIRWLRLSWQLHRQRRVLAELPDHLLRDIGVTRRDARLEAAKPFWK